MAKDYDSGRVEARGREKRGSHTHQCPGAFLAGMAGQCPRGQLGTARGRLHRRRHRDSTGSTLPWTLPTALHDHQNHHRIILQFMLGRSSLTASSEVTRASRIRARDGKISTERRHPPNPVGGGGRGCWGASFAIGGGGGDCRRHTELPGDDGGD
jgi:hypothetical protein